MLDVARLANVGAMTVSRFVSGKARVSEESSKRIQWAIDKLEYKPNELARALRNMTTQTIGVIVPSLSDPFFAVLAHEVDHVAKSHGYSVIVTSSNDTPEVEEAEAQQMLRRHVAGMILIPSATGFSYLNRMQFHGTPVVTLGRPATEPWFDSVLVQNKDGARLAVEHLIQHGYQRISFLGLQRELYTMSVRYQGYREAMGNAKRSPSPYVDVTAHTNLTAALRKLLTQKNAPNALFVANISLLKRVLLSAGEMKLSIPQDLAIASFDDHEMADLISPRPTVVRQPTVELGRVSATLLFERITSGLMSETGKRVVLPVELIIRQSCGCSPEARPHYPALPHLESSNSRVPPAHN